MYLTHNCACICTHSFLCIYTHVQIFLWEYMHVYIHGTTKHHGAHTPFCVVKFAPATLQSRYQLGLTVGVSRLTILYFCVSFYSISQFAVFLSFNVQPVYFVVRRQKFEPTSKMQSQRSVGVPGPGVKGPCDTSRTNHFRVSGSKYILHESGEKSRELSQKWDVEFVQMNNDVFSIYSLWPLNIEITVVRHSR